ncbi:unnamed protein product [Closterium sp. Naga37s-1]|nr:unnamed protein product [Closterium sp. Naga37s-1]
MSHKILPYSHKNRSSRRTPFLITPCGSFALAKFIAALAALLAPSTTAALKLGAYVPPADPTTTRGPCPGFNTMANHGVFPRDGSTIPRSLIVAAFSKFYSFSPTMSNAILDSAFAKGVGDPAAQTIDLVQLRAHNKIEHDVSLVRDDSYFGNNYLVKTRRPRSSTLGRLVGRGNVIGPRTVGVSRLLRMFVNLRRLPRDKRCSSRPPPVAFTSPSRRLHSPLLSLFPFPSRRPSLFPDRRSSLFPRVALPFSLPSPSLCPPVAFPFPSRRLPISLTSPSLFPPVAFPFPSRRLLFPLLSPSLFPPVAFPFPSRRLPFSLPSPTHFPLVAFSFPSCRLPFSLPSPSLFPPVAFPFPSRRLPISLSSPSLFPPVAFPFPSRRLPFPPPSPSLSPPVAFPFPSRRLPFALPSPSLFPPVAFPFPSRRLPFSLPSPSLFPPVAFPFPSRRLPPSLPSSSPNSSVAFTSLSHRPRSPLPSPCSFSSRPLFPGSPCFPSSHASPRLSLSVSPAHSLRRLPPIPPQPLPQVVGGFICANASLSDATVTLHPTPPRHFSTLILPFPHYHPPNPQLPRVLSATPPRPIPHSHPSIPPLPRSVSPTLILHSPVPPFHLPHANSLSRANVNGANPFLHANSPLPSRQPFLSPRRCSTLPPPVAFTPILTLSPPAHGIPSPHSHSPCSLSFPPVSPIFPLLGLFPPLSRPNIALHTPLHLAHSLPFCSHPFPLYSGDLTPLFTLHSHSPSLTPFPPPTPLIFPLRTPFSTLLSLFPLLLIPLPRPLLPCMPFFTSTSTPCSFCHTFSPIGSLRLPSFRSLHLPSTPICSPSNTPPPFPPRFSKGLTFTVLPCPVLPSHSYPGHSPIPDSLALTPPAPMLPFIPLPPSLFHPHLPPFSRSRWCTLAGCESGLSSITSASAGRLLAFRRLLSTNSAWTAITHHPSSPSASSPSSSHSSSSSSSPLTHLVLSGVSIAPPSSLPPRHLPSHLHPPRPLPLARRHTSSSSAPHHPPPHSTPPGPHTPPCG